MSCSTISVHSSYSPWSKVSSISKNGKHQVSLFGWNDGFARVVRHSAYSPSIAKYSGSKWGGRFGTTVLPQWMFSDRSIFVSDWWLSLPILFQGFSSWLTSSRVKTSVVRPIVIRRTTCPPWFRISRMVPTPLMVSMVSPFFMLLGCSLGHKRRASCGP